MRLLAVLAAWFLLVAGGCTQTQPPAPPPILQPVQAVDRVENDMFIAERIWPSAERAFDTGQTITITLRVTAKRWLEYVYWREAFGNTVINSHQDTEFMMLRVRTGATVQWQYLLEGVGAGQETIEGLIRAASAHVGQEERLRATVTVYESHR